jgi:hypothetical protein
VKSSPNETENVKLAREIWSFGRLIWRERNDLKYCGQAVYGVNRKRALPWSLTLAAQLAMAAQSRIRDSQQHKLSGRPASPTAWFQLLPAALL